MSERFTPAEVLQIQGTVLITLEIPGIPPSWNEIMRLPRKSKHRDMPTQGKVGAVWKDLVGDCCRFLPRSVWDDGILPLPEAVVSLIYHFPDKGRRDPDNYSGKFILDGLVSAGLIEDDSFAQIDLVIMRGADDPGKGFVEVQLCPR